MRVLLIGSAHPWRMERAVQRALRRAGHRALLIDDRRLKRRLGRRLTQEVTRRTARWFRPDFVLLSKCHALDVETVSAVIRGRPNAMWYHDAGWFAEPERPDVKAVIEVGRLADVFFVTGYEEEWRRHGLRAEFLPAAADRHIVPVPPRPEYASEIAFTGTGYDATRAEFLVDLSRHFRVRVWGTRWEPWRDRLDWSGRPVEGEEFAAVCSSSAITLGILPAAMRTATNAASDRTWMTILAGGFYLGPGVPGVAQLLRDGEHCAWYGDFDECVAKAERYLRDPAGRERVRATGERFVRQHHTYDARIGPLLAREPFVNPLAD